MNKIYKIVWNAAQEAWVAVSELAKGHVKASSSGKNAKQSTVVEEEGSTSFTLYSLGKAAAKCHGDWWRCGNLIQFKSNGSSR